MAATRTAHTVWNGDLMTGAGNTTLDSSGLGNFDVTWKARAEASEGKTSPEELIAAAHSACFSMAFSLAVAQAGHTPEEVNTKADGKEETQDLHEVWWFNKDGKVSMMRQWTAKFGK